MRRLKLQMQMTLDGFVSGPNGEMDWMLMDWDVKLKKFVSDLTDDIDCILLGRKLAQGFIPTWKSRFEDEKGADNFTKKMSKTSKVVFSRSLSGESQEIANWENTRVEHGDLRERVMALKEEEGRDMITYGGGEFVSALIKYDLIDEYHLFIHPVAIGKGLSIFRKLDEKHTLELNRAIPFSSGISALCYKKPLSRN
jgi:dihydrofolate reductase